jgi:hypothetical protein
LKVVTVVALANLLLLVVGVGSDQILTGENYQEGGDEKASVGLWRIYYGGDKSEAVCSGWPDGMTDTPLCTAVNASRAFFILAIMVDLFAGICGVVRLLGGEKYHDWADEQVFSLVSSGVFGLVGYVPLCLPCGVHLTVELQMCACGRGGGIKREKTGGPTVRSNGCCCREAKQPNSQAANRSARRQHHTHLVNVSTPP